MHTVLQTNAFEAGAKDAEMTEDEVHDLCVFLSANPEAGELIVGTGGARKFRIPFKGKGKRGGARVVTYYAGTDVPVFLLDVFSKGDKVNLSKAERNELRKMLADIAEAYREGVREKMKNIGVAS